MKKKIFIAAAVIISSSSQAQNNLSLREDSTKQLNEVVVTANKFPIKTSLTGKVLTVVTREQLEKSAGKDLSQVLAEQAGVYVNGANSNQGKDKSIYLRGARIDHTLITVDGVPLYDASGIGSNFDIRLLPIDNIERVEILKGSQSTLYGSDAIAGVINIITRKPSAKPYNVSGVLNYASYNTVRANAVVSGNVDKLDYSAGYTYNKTDGINETVDTITAPHVTDKDGYTQHSVFANLGLKPTAGVRIQPYVRYTDLKGNIDQGAFTDELDYSTRNKNLQAGVKNEIHIGKSVLNVLYNYQRNERSYTDDSVKSQNGFAKYSHGSYKATEHFADAYLVAPVSADMKLTAGIDYRSSNSDQLYNSISFYGPFKTELGKDSLHHSQLGIYTAFVLNAANGLSVEMGGRFNHHSQYGNNTVFNFNPSFLIKDQVKLFLNVSSGYKVPSLYQLYSEYGNRQLDPETAITFESGAQYFSKNKKIMARATYFNRSVKDVIFFYTNPLTFQSKYINQDKQKDNGVELETSIQFGKTSMLKFFYTWVDGNVTTKTAKSDTSYFNLIRRPKSSFGFSFGTNFTKQLYMSTSINTFGKRTDLTYDANFNQVQVDLSAYALWNMYAEYAVPKFKTRFFSELRNMLNSKYSEVYGFNTMGFNASIGARFAF